MISELVVEWAPAVAGIRGDFRDVPDIDQVDFLSTLTQARVESLVRMLCGVRSIRYWLVVAALFGFGVTSWYDRKGLHRIPAETTPEKTAVPA